MSNTKRLEKSSKNLSQLMKEYYITNHIRAKQGKFVTWVAIVVPIELLKGFDLVVAVPENHAATCAAKKVGPIQAEKAENRGYSMDLCSYARIDLGTAFSNGEGSPTQGLPRPNMMISNNNNCSLLVKWFDVYHREFNIPHYILDVPFCYEGQKKKDLKYIVNQFEGLISKIQNETGQTFDLEKVREAIRYTNEAMKHWKRFLSFAAEYPSGITAFDSFVHMAPYLSSFRGTRALVEHFKLLAEETGQNMKDGLYPVPDEKYRLLWDNIAPWHQLRPMSTRLAKLKTNIIYASYTSCMGTIEGNIERYQLDPRNPLEELARIQNFSVCPYGLNLRFKAMSKMVEKFDIDGIVFTSNFSCKVYSVMQLDLMNMMKEKYPEIPSVMINVDHADVRKYNEEKVFVKIEALLEKIESSRL
jgi:benzoyl-CoA reductase/2-hydroxyglutaryl-CoA dehydratase subunit BcrC/BadD/HgdB